MGLIVKSEKLPTSTATKKSGTTIVRKSNGIKGGTTTTTNVKRTSTAPRSTSAAPRTSTYQPPQPTPAPILHQQSYQSSNTNNYDEDRDAYSQGEPSRVRSVSFDNKSSGMMNERTRSNVSFQSQESVQKPRTLTLKERLSRRRTKGKGTVNDMQYLVEEGPMSFRAFAFIGGFWMILSSLLDFINMSTSGDATPMILLISINLWVFGFIIVMLEGRPFHVQIPFVHEMIVQFFAFFKYTWGRGFFYFAAGCLQFFLFSQFNMISGIYMMILGIISIVVGYKASLSLAGLRSSLSTREEIAYLFSTFDRDRDGYLSTEEFRELMLSMDQNVDYNEFVAALGAIDLENNQMISQHDFMSWWQGYSDSEMAPYANCGCCNKGSYGRNHSHSSQYLHNERDYH